METDWDAIAETAYEAYCKVVRAAEQPLSTPAWEDLPPRMQEAWRAATEEACHIYIAAALA